jgi:excisionase family DNA binding protein
MVHIAPLLWRTKFLHFSWETYTAQEVAAILKVSTRSVERLVAKGTLSAVHVGRRLRITHDQLQAYLRQESTTPESQP